ncbi:hypothetical protein GGS20DRAFT_575111 [Poronia punctata]|nr:hypothetical protein GGS20DRAFT_575111 [Poronia punctata]
MAEIRTSPTATPKRKRDWAAEMHPSVSPTPHPFSKAIFSFQPPSLQLKPSDGPVEDGNTSPRSKVAQRFGDLTIHGDREGPGGIERTNTGMSSASGGGAATGYTENARRAESGKLGVVPRMSRFNFDAGVNSTKPDMQMHIDGEADTTASRKRTKISALNRTGVDDSSGSTQDEAAAPTTESFSFNDAVNKSLPVSLDSAAAKQGKAGHPQKAHLSSNRVTDSKPRSRRRAGTPPLSSRKKVLAASAGEERDEDTVIIIDPVRAALTWREDEITIYDPEDEDDDGTGINGVGFKPTAAIAYQRAQKRRQQLADYKKREESEARARRTQRRRGQPGGAVELTRKHSVVRVHFSDAPPTTVMTT